MIVDEEDRPLYLVLQALADPVRLRMVRRLREGEQCICRLTGDVGLSQGTVSHHMSVLKQAGLVLDRRDARWTYYRLSPVVTAQITRTLTDLLDVSATGATSADCCDG